MFLLILEIANITLFLMSVRHIHAPFHTKRKLTKEMQKNSSQNAKIRQQEVKLFIYFFVLTGR